jgi:wyosine [tRNA(Phe)-imidazoG37] synthetase (radical SAM superfamily)
MVSKLTTTSHCSDIVGLTYVYPVISRRMGGLSIGINFNTNNACNWRCIYCQVPGLMLGAAPAIDLTLLEDELRYFLNEVLNGDFYERFGVDHDKRVIKDIAIAGNGEPTSLKEFPEAVALIGEIATALGIFPQSRYVLITNGSLVHQAKVQAGLKALEAYGGEVWFKLDSATEEGRALINNTAQSCQASVNNLMLSTQCCKTKLQTCLVDYDDQGLSEREQSAYLDLLAELKKNGCQLQDVLLYSLARLSLQPEAAKLKPLGFDVLESFASKIRMLGFNVSVSS